MLGDSKLKDMGILSGIVSGVGNIVGSALGAWGANKQARINADVARENTDKTILANKQMAEYQYSKDLEMWNLANKYNSPEMQMERYKEAGLNPNLIYGSGASAGQTATSLPKYNAPTLQYNYQPTQDIPGMISQFQNVAFKQAQIDNVKSQTENKRASTALAVWEKWMRGNKYFKEYGAWDNLQGQGEDWYPSLYTTAGIVTGKQIGRAHV